MLIPYLQTHANSVGINSQLRVISSIRGMLTLIFKPNSTSMISCTILWNSLIS